MKSGFYSRIAWSNLKKNYRFFIPRMLSEAGLLACFYIAITLVNDDRLSKIKGGSYIPTFMIMGSVILALLSIIITLYTNGFLMKQRKKEFGIYNVLGMEKRHVGSVLFFESFWSSFISVVFGLILGVLFYRLCSLLICKLLQSEIIIGSDFLNVLSLAVSGGFFILLDIFAYVINLISIAKMKPIDLINSKSAGEKEPKIKWVMFIVGLLSLGGGYYISITTKNPLEALYMFFIAIVLVIIGTYFLFVSGSIFVLKLLKNNKKFYYNKKHMPAVSGLLYRMKQNSVGLSSIAILATGVLVMISTTISLYSGMNGTLKKNYPYQIYLSAGYSSSDGEYHSLSHTELEKIFYDACEKNDVKIKDTFYEEYLSVSYYTEGNKLYGKNETDVQPSAFDSNLATFIFITEENYERFTGIKLNLGENEIAIANPKSNSTLYPSFINSIILHGHEYKTKTEIANFPISNSVLISAYPVIGVVVSGEKAMYEIYKGQLKAYGSAASDYTISSGISFEDLGAAEKKNNEIKRQVVDDVERLIREKCDDISTIFYSCSDYWDAKESLIGMYGTLLFLGFLLGGVCIFATILIIYYKQISEGYEDRDKFQIMEKVGMSRKEILSTINTQVLLVFFLPLITAGIHFVFAYPILTKMLNVLMLYKETLFLTCGIITFAIFSVIYILIYLKTSKTYYKIVK